MSDERAIRQVIGLLLDGVIVSAVDDVDARSKAFDWLVAELAKSDILGYEVDPTTGAVRSVDLANLLAGVLMLLWTTTGDLATAHGCDLDDIVAELRDKLTDPTGSV